MTLTPARVLQFLRDIEQGLVTLAPLRPAASVWAGDVIYRASNGWQIVIFDDANEWDYIDEVQDADGDLVDFDTIWDHPDWTDVRAYTPNPEVAWRCYGMGAPR